MFYVFSPANETRVEKVQLESYVPLRMHFGIGFSISGLRSGLEGTLSDGKIRIVVYSHVPWLFDAPSREEFVIEPTEAEWEEFFRVCEKANIWGLRNDGESFSDVLVVRPGISWRLELEYPDRTLEIGGGEVFVPPGVLMGAIRFLGDVIGIMDEDHGHFISDNIRIAGEHENIQMIFDAIQRLLGERASKYRFNLVMHNH